MPKRYVHCPPQSANPRPGWLSTQGVSPSELAKIQAQISILEVHRPQGRHEARTEGGSLPLDSHLPFIVMPLKCPVHLNLQIQGRDGRQCRVCRHLRRPKFIPAQISIGEVHHRQGRHEARTEAHSNLPLLVIPWRCPVHLNLQIQGRGGCQCRVCHHLIRNSQNSSPNQQPVPAHSKSNAFKGPWTPSKSLDPLTHICPPFPYPMAVGKHREHDRPPHLQSQHPFVWLKSGRSGSLAHSKSNALMGPWTPSKSPDPLTHICPPFPYPMAVGKHREHDRPRHLLSQHPTIYFSE